MFAKVVDCRRYFVYVEGEVVAAYVAVFFGKTVF